MLSDMKRKCSQHPRPGTPWLVPVLYTEFRGNRNCTAWILGFPGKRGQRTVFAQRSLPCSWAVFTSHWAVINKPALSPGERPSVPLREKLGRWKIQEDSPKRRCVFSLHSKSHRKSPDYSSFPRNPGWKKIKGPHYFPTNTHTHTHARTKEPCKDLNTSCACPCQNFLNPPPFTLACQAMQIFERPPRFRSVWCKNPHRIQAVKAVTHSYSAARSPVRQAKLLYSRRSLEHTLAHLSHRSKERNHLETSPACLPFLKSNAKKLLPSRQRTGWHRYGILGKENEVLSQQLLKLIAQMSSAV